MTTHVGDWPFVGRHAESRAVLEALREHGAVVVAGPAGVGKSRLVRELLAHEDPRAPLTVATASARGTPLGAFAGLLGPESDTSAELPTVQRAVDTLTGGGWRTLAVDDAHLLDVVSATVLWQVVQRGGTRVLATVRAGAEAPDAVTALWKDGPAVRLELSALGDGDTDALLRAGLGGTVALATRARLRAVSRGNALWLRHLVDGERAAGRLRDRAGVWEWHGEPELSPALADLVGADIGRLGEQQQRVLELLAFGEPLDVELLNRLADPVTIEGLAEHGLLTVERDGERWDARLAHPLYAETVRGRVSTPRARSLRSELAEALGTVGTRRSGDRLRRAVLALDGLAPADPSLFVDAAAHATALGDLDLAARLFRAAVAGGAGFAAQLGLAQTLAWAMHVDDADVEAAAAAALAGTPHEYARATLVRASTQFFMGQDPDAANEVLDEAQRRLAAEPAVADVHALRSVFLACVNRPSRAEELARAASASSSVSDTGLTWARWTRVSVRAFTGRGDPLDDLAEQALEAAGRSAETVVMQGSIGYFEVLGLVLEGRVAPARRRERWLRERSGEFSSWHGGLYTGRIALHTGRLEEASDALEALPARLTDEAGGWGPWMLGMLGRARAMRGDADAAAAALVRLENVRHPGILLSAPEEQLLRAWVAAARGSVTAAVGAAVSAAEAARAAGQSAVEVEARHTAVCFGDRGQAHALTALAARLGSPLARAAQAHARAWADRDAPALDGVSATLEELELVPVAADAAAQAAVVHREAGRPGEGARAAERAAALAARCDLRTPAQDAAHTPASVTSREREVAVLAAAGLTDRQIAARLGVSVRTVESTIYRARTRLGLADRRQFVAVAAPSGGPSPT